MPQDEAEASADGVEKHASDDELLGDIVSLDVAVPTPIIGLLPLALGGVVLFGGFQYGYSSQLKSYAEEEKNVGKGKKWARQPGSMKYELLAAHQSRPGWSPQGVALRALGLGTLAACGSFALGTAGVFWYFGVKNAQEFSNKMRKVIPPKYEALSSIVRPPLQRLKVILTSTIGYDSSDTENEIQSTQKSP